MSCKNCGGDMIGDGFTAVMHCEYADESELDCLESDADTVYCAFEEQ